MSADYEMIITGPRGVALVLKMDATLRLVRELCVDDELCRELLIVTSVAAGNVEGVCMRKSMGHGARGMESEAAENLKSKISNLKSEGGGAS